MAGLDAAHALAESGGQRALGGDSRSASSARDALMPALMGRISDNKLVVRHANLRALAAVARAAGPESVLPSVAPLVTHRRSGVRDQAVRVLAAAALAAGEDSVSGRGREAVLRRVVEAAAPALSDTVGRVQAGAREVCAAAAVVLGPRSVTSGPGAAGADPPVADEMAAGRVEEWAAGAMGSMLPRGAGAGAGQQQQQRLLGAHAHGSQIKAQVAHEKARRGLGRRLQQAVRGEAPVAYVGSEGFVVLPSDAGAGGSTRGTSGARGRASSRRELGAGGLDAAAAGSVSSHGAGSQLSYGSSSVAPYGPGPGGRSVPPSAGSARPHGGGMSRGGLSMASSRRSPATVGMEVLDPAAEGQGRRRGSALVGAGAAALGSGGALHGGAQAPPRALGTAQTLLSAASEHSGGLGVGMGMTGGGQGPGRGHRGAPSSALTTHEGQGQGTGRPRG